MNMNIRVGFGYDVHRLTEGHELWLGGVKIPHHQGLEGHSDADVLVHAIADALLGAAGLRDIGYHFPDTDPEYKGISSLVLLERVASLLMDNGWSVGNVDATVSMQQPKIATYIPRMQELIAGALGIEAGDVSIKATTTEGLGFEGREEGVSAYAVALVTQS
jgi:2-C-methyl-D-erythritol 2,4-cyclodiphosphate synthase